MTELAGKVALVSGAKGGLGVAVTTALLNAGATVVGVSRSIRASDFDSERFLALPSEISSSQAAAAAVDSAIGQAGQIDILTHLVGGFAGGSVAETEDAELERMMEVNYKSLFYMAKAVLPHMRSRGSGCVIAIGSRAAVEPAPGAAAYSASKAALVALIRSIAIENAGAGISANAILPGTIDTPANRAAMPGADFAKWVHPEQIARLIVALVSGELSEVTGAAIPVYGRGIEA